MAKVELEHWWYKSLHELTLKNVQNKFSDKSISIIDAGCGTGGLLFQFKKKGYNNCSGIDISIHAIEHAKARGMNVVQGNIININKYYAANSCAVIISHDVFYFLSIQERKEVLQKYYALLQPNGIVILNLPALKIFRGMHDLSVGIISRLHKRNVKEMLRTSGFKLIKFIYWPFFLSPLIIIIRFFQRIKLKLNPHSERTSDIEIPSPIINKFCYLLTKIENTLLPYKPIGSSIFIILRKDA